MGFFLEMCCASCKKGITHVRRKRRVREGNGTSEGKTAQDTLRQGGSSMDQVKIGKFIAVCRREQGLTQVQLAEKLGVSNKAVSKWENGQMSSGCDDRCPCYILPRNRRRL